MGHFNPGEAIFGALTAEIADPPKMTTFSYVNSAALQKYGQSLLGRNVFELFIEIHGSNELAKKAFKRLFDENHILFEGKLSGKYIQYHSMINVENGHMQAAIADTTESHRAQEGFIYTAGALARAAEVNDEDTGLHINRINKYSEVLTDQLGLSQQFIKNISVLAQLHDVGKVHVHPQILRKPGKLTDNEYAEMKRHAAAGAKIIGDHPRLAIAEQIALGHHEKWDGTGYPNGLAGVKIPIAARIVAIVDVFDALVSQRPYKPAFSYEKAYLIMSEGDERTKPLKHFDPTIHEIFLKNYDKFTEIHSQML